MTREWVLVIEDQPIMRLMACDMVEEAGYQAIGAPDATWAMRVLGERDDIGVVFADIDLPRGIDGLALERAIQSRWPTMGLVLTSANAPPRELPAGAAFYSKPYRVSEVVAALAASANERRLAARP